MKKTLLILAAATALSATLGIPAWSAMGNGAQPAGTFVLQPEDEKTLLRLIEDDGEDDDMPKASRSTREDDDEGEGEDDDGDDDGGSAKANNPAPAGSAPPPSNGLFENGAAPKAQVN